MSTLSLVLSTVNTPHSQHLSAQELADCLLDPVVARAMAGHMSSFFAEVEPALQFEFAHLFNITDEQLVSSAKTFAEYSGESYPLAA